MRVEALQMTPVQMRAESHFNENKAVDRKQKSFGAFLKDAVAEVNGLQVDAEKANVALAAGQVEDISEVMVAGTKAQIALQLTMQVRNKVVEAYQEVMRMQV